MRATTPEEAEREIATFRPHLLVHNDTAPISEGALAGVPSRVEVLYSDSMDARVWADGAASEAHDMSAEGLLRAVDGAAGLAGREATPG